MSSEPQEIARPLDPTARWKAIAIFAVFAVVAIGVVLQQTLWKGPPPPRKAPEVTFVDRHGKELHLSDFRGKVVVLNFWATWCGPCVMEMPSMVQLAGQLKGKPDLVLLAASVDDEGWNKVDPFLHSRGFDALEDNVVLDTHEGAHQFGTDKLPETWVIGRDGTILDPRPALKGVADVWQSRFMGPQEWNNPRISAWLESL